jgi:GTP-binding protein
MFRGYEQIDQSTVPNRTGRLVSMDNGVATAYALNLLEARGVLFIEPGQEVYEGMVIGENSRPGDMEVNPTKGKKLTNVRSVLADEKVVLQPPRRLGLEEFITYMSDDEVLEITPNAIRLRKRFLNASDRLKAQKILKQQKQNAK